MRRTSAWRGVVLLAVLATASSALVVAEETAAVPLLTMAVPEEPTESCLDFTPAEPSELDTALSFDLDVLEAVAPKPKPCRQACQDRPWCECTYNGLPRISCNPCCYMHPYTGEQVCFD